MKVIKARMFFEDEAPQIGCGERGVTIKIGRKWVHIVENSSGRKVRWSLDQYEGLANRITEQQEIE